MSYSLEWNSGGTQETNWQSLVGTTSENTDLRFELTSLSTGTAYKFQYRVQNEVGWSEPSEIMMTYAGLETSKITTTLTQVDPVDPTLVLFTWNEPTYLGGIPLRAYYIEIRGSDG